MAKRRSCIGRRTTWAWFARTGRFEGTGKLSRVYTPVTRHLTGLLTGISIVLSVPVAVSQAVPSGADVPAASPPCMLSVSKTVVSTVPAFGARGNPRCDVRAAFSRSSPLCHLIQQIEKLREGDRSRLGAADDCVSARAERRYREGHGDAVIAAGVDLGGV